MSKKLWEWGVQKRKPSVCAINAQSGTSLQIVPPAPSPHRKGNGNSRKFPANPTTEQRLHLSKLHMSKKLWEWGGQKRKPSVCAINAQSGTSLQIVPPAPSPHRKAMEIRVNSLQILPRNKSCTNANYIWARSCGNGEAKNANPPFVQSTHKAVRACKLFLLHHRRFEKAMEIRVNSLQILPRNNSCTNANYIWARSFWNGEAKNANPPFVQSTHKAARACKLFLLHHRRFEKEWKFA